MPQTEITNIHFAILKRFQTLMAKDRLGHAYLFVGPAQVGKTATARAVAKMMNCLEPIPGDPFFCGACPACRKIDATSHPDVYCLEAGDSQTIKIAQIRELVTKVQLRPFEARKKVFILRNIETMTLESSNALLKTLEEPTKDSLLILTTAVPENNLDTIKSRCQQLTFFPAASRQVARQLEGEGVGDLNEAQFLALYSEGCLGRARHLKRADFSAQKNEIIDNLIFDRNNEAYVKILLSAPEQLPGVLGVLLTWFRDLLLLKIGLEEGRLVHADRLADLARLQPAYTPKQITEIIDEVVNTRSLFNDNLNIKIALTLLRDKIWVRS